MEMKYKTFDNLRELTGQDSGIVIYPNGDTVICNWEGLDGLPRLFAGMLIGLGEPIAEPEWIENVDQMELKKILNDKTRSIFDQNGDLEGIISGENIGDYNACYTLPDETKIIAPTEWN